MKDPWGTPRYNWIVWSRRRSFWCFFIKNISFSWNMSHMRRFSVLMFSPVRPLCQSGSWGWSRAAPRRPPEQLHHPSAEPQTDSGSASDSVRQSLLCGSMSFSTWEQSVRMAVCSRSAGLLPFKYPPAHRSPLCYQVYLQQTASFWTYPGTAWPCGCWGSTVRTGRRACWERLWEQPACPDLRPAGDISADSSARCRRWPETCRSKPEGRFRVLHQTQGGEGLNSN